VLEFGIWSTTYTINVTATNVNFPSNTHTPTLSMGQVTPATGNTSVYYKFSVNYTDVDNNPPNPIKAIIDGIPYQMMKQNQSDLNYKDGVIYEYIMAMDNSTHSYYFNATDLKYSARLPLAGTYSGPAVTYINVNPPTLLNGIVIPPSGNNYTDYRFQVDYKDADNNPPTYVKVTINETSYLMTPQNPTDRDYINGATYIYETKLSAGQHKYQYNASDGINFASIPSNGSYIGPYVYLAYWAFWDNVESDQDGWTITGTPVANSTFGWHITQRSAKSPTHSWWCGDNTTGQYHNNWNTSLVTPLLNLTTAYLAILSFEHKLETLDLNHMGYVEIKINGSAQWKRLALYNRTIATWTKQTFNISSYLGKLVNIRFRFYSSLGPTYSGWYIDNIIVETQQNLFAPVLNQGQVTPSTGNLTTLYTYKVRYSDVDANSPKYVNVVIDGKTYTMVKENPTEKDYTMGLNYVFSTRLDNRTHNYYFLTSDGLFITRYPSLGNNSGPLVTATYAIPPTLTNIALSPLNGQLTTTFTFNVTYTDAENNPPSYVNVTINGTSHAMAKVYSSDTNCMDGVIFQYKTTFPEDGVYIYYFSTSDGWNKVLAPSVGTFIGPYLYSYRLWTNTIYSNSITTRDRSDNFIFEVRNDDFAAVAIKPPQNATNLDLNVYQDYTLTTLVAKSNVTDNAVDFIVIDRHNETSTVNWYAKVDSVVGLGTYRIEAEYSIPDVTVATENFTYTMQINEIFKMVEFTGHSPNSAYNISIYNTAGMDLGLYIVITTGGRVTAINYSNLGGVNAKESVIFYPKTSAVFGVIVTNEKTGSGSYQLKIFTEKPKVTIISPQNKTYTTSNINVNLSCNIANVHTFWYRIRNSTQWLTGNLTWTPGTNVILNDGLYSLFAWANDSAGVKSNPAKVTFTVDTTAPIPVIRSPLNQTYDVKTVDINLSSASSDLHILWYRIYNISGNFWVDSTIQIWSSITPRTLTEGVFRICAWANDTHGNILESPVNTTFTMDTPPSVVISSPENKTYTSAVIPITLTCDDSTLHKMWYEISNGTHLVVDKTMWVVGANTILNDGYYTVYGWANDTLGRTQLIPSNISFTIDTSAPEVTILSPINNTYHAINFLINLSCVIKDLNTIWYRFYNVIDHNWLDSANVTWITPIFRNFAEGSYAIYVWSNDTFGNQLKSPEIVYFSIDIAPQILSLSIQNGTISYNGKLLLNISINAADLNMIWYRIFKDGTWITEKIIWTAPILLQLDNGDYILNIWTNDTHGNEGCWIISFSIQIPPPPGPNDYIWIIIVAIGVVSGLAIFYRYRKSRRIKQKAKVKNTKPSQSFAESVRPKD